MKKILALSLLAGSLFANPIVKLATNQITLQGEKTKEEINFYSFEPSHVFEKNEFTSCILQDQTRLNKKTMFCTKDIETFYTEIEGTINPDGNLFSHESLLKFKKFELNLR